METEAFGLQNTVNLTLHTQTPVTVIALNPDDTSASESLPRQTTLKYNTANQNVNAKSTTQPQEQNFKAHGIIKINLKEYA